jgi:hypothetical protein
MERRGAVAKKPKSKEWRMRIKKQTREQMRMKIGGATRRKKRKKKRRERTKRPETNHKK